MKTFEANTDAESDADQCKFHYDLFNCLHIQSLQKV
jgi:hypothetical protein